MVNHLHKILYSYCTQLIPLSYSGNCQAISFFLYMYRLLAFCHSTVPCDGYLDCWTVMYHTL